MYKKISALFTIVFFVSIVSYFFYYNPHEVTVNFSSDTSWKLPLALTLILSFFLGVVFVTLFAVFFGIKLKLEQYRLSRQMKMKDTHYEDLKKAQDLIAIEDADTARSLLQKILQKDPDDILSRIALAKTWLIQNNSKEALRLLEETRAQNRKSPTLLVTIAEAQIQSGNKTAAHDSILLALREYPKNISLLEKAISLSRDLGKLGDARFLAEELMRVSPYADQQRISELMASIALDEITEQKNTDPESYESGLLKILKDHKEFVPAQLRYAEVLFSRNESEQAVSILKKAAAKYHSLEALQKLVTFWLATDNPSMALSILKESIESDHKALGLAAHGLLVQTLLHLEQTEDARNELKELENRLTHDKGKSLFLIALRAKLDSKSPGRSKTNLSLEHIIIREAEHAGLPALPGSIIHPNIGEKTPVNPESHLSVI
jgi:predicted Zn-dependent protease